MNPRLLPSAKDDIFPEAGLRARPQLRRVITTSIVSSLRIEFSERVSCRSTLLRRAASWAILIGLNIYGGNALAADTTELTGTLVVRHYGHENEITDVREGTFQLACTTERYAIRMLKPTAFVEQGMFVVSDGKSVYQTQKLRKIGGAQEQSNGPYGATAGRCQHGKMPMGFYGWGPVEALALSYHLLNHSGQVLADGELRAEYFPEVISKRSRELRRPYVHTEVLRDANGAYNSVQFWGLKTEKAAAPYSHREDCFLLGELKLENIRLGVAEKVTFVVNGLAETPVPGKPRYGTPLIDVELLGLAATSTDTGLFSEVAYDAGEKAMVSDSRFPGFPDLRYVVKSEGEPPLDQTVGPPQKAYEQQLIRNKKTQSKRQSTVIIAGLMSLFILSMSIIFLRTRVTNRKRKPDISIQ